MTDLKKKKTIQIFVNVRNYFPLLFVLFPNGYYKSFVPLVLIYILIYVLRNVKLCFEISILLIFAYLRVKFKPL